MSATPVGEVSRLDEDGIREMLRTKPDTNVESYDFSFTGSSAPSTPSTLLDTDDDDEDNTPLGKLLKKDAGAKTTATPTVVSGQSMVGAILEQISSETDFKLFVNGLLRSNDGARELGAFARHFPGKPAWSAVIPLLANAPAARVGLLLEEGLKEDDTRSEALLVAAATRVCGAGQPEDVRTTTWLAALGPDVKNVAGRDAVLAKCGVGGREQMKARLKAAKGEQLGRALDGMKGELFGVAVSALAESKSVKAAATFLGDTSNNDKFDAVAKATDSFAAGAKERGELLKTFVNGKSGSLDELKAKWLGTRLDELHAQGAEEPVLKQLYGEMAAGRVHIPGIRMSVITRVKGL